MRASLSGKKHCPTLPKSCASLDPAQLNKAWLLGQNQAVPGGGIDVNRYRGRPAQSTPQCGLLQPLRFGIKLPFSQGMPSVHGQTEEGLRAFPAGCRPAARLDGAVPNPTPLGLQAAPLTASLCLPQPAQHMEAVKLVNTLKHKLQNP